MVTHPGFGTPVPLADDVAVVLTTAPTSAPPHRREHGDAGRRHGDGCSDGARPTYARTAYHLPAQLQAATLPILPQGDCVRDALPICAGQTSPNICIGDSGGPLL